MGFGEGFRLRSDLASLEGKKRGQVRPEKQRASVRASNCVRPVLGEQDVYAMMAAGLVFDGERTGYVVARANLAIPYAHRGPGKSIEHVVPASLRIGPGGASMFRADGTPFGIPTTVLHYQPSTQLRVPVDLWLDEQRELEDDDRALGLIASQVARRCADKHQRALLVRWFQTHAPVWAAKRVPALAAALEAAADLNLVEALDVLASVLEDDEANPVVALVAAQRARRFQVEHHEVRRRITASLRLLVTKWSAAPSTIRRAELAAPSIPVLGDRDDLAWVAERTVDQPAQVAWGLVQGVLDRAAGPGNDVDEHSRAILYAAFVKRLTTSEEESADPMTDHRPELRASILWCLGGLAPRAELASASGLLVSAFAHGGPERIAALNGARLAIRRWEATGIEAFVRALEVLPADLRYRFLALLVTLSPG